jgi:L-aspartate oxidase
VARADLRAPLQRAMTRGAGVLRSGPSLTGAGAELAGLAAPGDRSNTASWEATNLLTVASALVAAALRREETRGCHWREDHPTASDRWLGHLLASLSETGTIEETWEPL